MQIVSAVYIFNNKQQSAFKINTKCMQRELIEAEQSCFLCLLLSYLCTNNIAYYAIFAEYLQNGK